MDMMCTIVIGVFDTRQRAERAVVELRAAGLRADQLGTMFLDTSGNPAGTGTDAGAAEIDVPAEKCSWTEFILDATTGATGLARTLGGLGVLEADALYFEREVAEGRFLVAVDCSDGRTGDARALIGRYCGYGRIPSYMR